MQIKLHPVLKGKNRYCGPAVVSALTKINTDEAARLMRTVRGRRAIKGSHLCEVNGALRHFGLQAVQIHGDRNVRLIGYTFATWARLFRREVDEVFLIVAGNHWQLVQGRRYVCGQSIKIVPVSKAPHRRARVTETYKLVACTAKALIVEQPVRTVAVSLDRKVRDLAARLGWRVDFEQESEAWWVAPKHDDEVDIFEDEHFAYSREEVLTKLKQVEKYHLERTA